MAVRGFGSVWSRHDRLGAAVASCGPAIGISVRGARIFLRPSACILDSWRSVALANLCRRWIDLAGRMGFRRLARTMNGGRTTVLWALGAFVLLSVLSLLVPPMQSPDENAHLMRAAMLSHGQWGLQPPPADTPAELASPGGWVDAGLAQYSHAFME